MKNIKNRMKTKYILLEQDDKTLHNYLQNEDNYREFIQNLSNIMITEPTYVYFIYQRIKFIDSEIQNHSKDKEINIYEKFIEKRLKYIEPFSSSFKGDFKTQYAYFYLCNIKLPFALRDETLFDKMIKENYENFNKMEKVINDGDEDLKESLKGNMSSLLTINSILKENNNVNDSLISLFYEISSSPIEKENFEDNLNYLYCKMYQHKTMRRLKEFVDEKQKKQKIKSKTLY